MPTLILQTHTQPLLPEEQEQAALQPVTEAMGRKRHRLRPLIAQLLRFAVVGGLNTAVDLLILNALLWRWPTRNTWLLLGFNTIAYLLGAINSFLCNKYWTFRQQQPVTVREAARFALTTLLGIACNDAILWIMGSALHPALLSATLWANVSKLFAIGGTVLVSYLGMRLWVFVQRPKEVQL